MRTRVVCVVTNELVIEIGANPGYPYIGFHGLNLFTEKLGDIEICKRKKYISYQCCIYSFKFIQMDGKSG